MFHSCIVLSSTLSQYLSLEDYVKFSNDEEEESLESLYRIGLFHAKQGKPRDAIFYFDKVLQVNPHHINALTSKGNALGKLGRYEEAISIYDKVLSIKPDHHICLINEGLSFHYLGKYQQAIDCYDKIINANAKDANAIYHKACIKSLQGKVKEALVLLEGAIKIDPQFAEKARLDIDFQKIQENPQFKSLTS